MPNHVRDDAALRPYLHVHGEHVIQKKFKRKMNRGLKRLLQIYPVTRNWTVVSCYTVPFRLVQYISRACSTDWTNYTQQKDVTLPLGKHASNDTQILNVFIRRELNKATIDYQTMTMHDALNTMSALYTKSINMKDVKNIATHAGFVNLCDVIYKNVRFMQINDILKTLNIVAHFKIPSNSILIQSLLQIIRVTINEIPLAKIIYIDVLLKRLDSTPLRDALQIALPLVFEAQLPTKLDSDDMILLRASLRFTIKNNIQNPKVQDMILEILWKNRNNIDTRTAFSVFCSLCHMSHLSEITFDILPCLQRILIVNAKLLDTQNINTMLGALLFAIKCNKEYERMFYNEALVDASINSALLSNMSFEIGIRLLDLLNRLQHVHLPLLEYLAAKCFEQPELLKGASYREIFAFLKGSTIADYKPVFWDTIRDAISASKVEDRPFEKSTIKFALCLIALDYYSPNLIRNVFSNYTKNYYLSDQLCLYQSIKTLYPMYDGPWPRQEVLERASTLAPKVSAYSLKAPLEMALGGPQYIRTNLRTKLGHHIDHVIVMRKGGYPVAINVDISSQNNTFYIEDIQIPSESQVILIFNFPDAAYAVNSQRLKSTWWLKIKSIEALTNFDTIVINSNSWMKLPEFERIPYLMQAIKLKCDDLSNISAY